jgi:hypothetical protein
MEPFTPLPRPAYAPLPEWLALALRGESLPPKRREVHPRLRIRWERVGLLVAVLFVGFCLGVIAASTIIMGNMDSSLNMGPATLPACATEDSTGCYWDADTRGNGLGVDVIDVPPCTDAIADAGGICIGEPR